MTNLLFVGDVVGEPGMKMVRRAVPWLKQSESLQTVIVNAENASDGTGLTPNLYRQLRQAGVDGVTLGDHIYKKQEIIKILVDANEPICRPINFPEASPGKGIAWVGLPSGNRLALLSVLGRSFMRHVDCPFAALDRCLSAITEQTKCIIVDVHAEATADKIMLGRYLDGRVSAVMGTHTHVATADEQILPGGTAYITDVGMTGPYDGVLGRRYDRVLFTNRTFVPTSFDVATGDPRLAGVVINLDEATGKAQAIRRVMVREGDVPKTT